MIQRLDLAGIPIGMTAATQAGRVTDLAVIESGPNRLDQFSVGRSGRLRKAGSVDLPSLPHDLATADFDGDGRTSVLVSYPGVAPLTYLDNVHQFDLGRRGPALTSDLSSGASCGGDLAVADLDGDGTSDLAVADACSFDVWVLISI